MKNSNNPFLFFTLLIFSQLYCMEQLPQKPVLKPYDLPVFKVLPSELKSYVLSFVLTGDLEGMSRGLYNLAALNKEYHALINNEQRMVALLESVPRICNGISLVEKLRNKKHSLPAMQSQCIDDWYWKKDKVPLKAGPQLIVTAIENNPLGCAVLLRKNDIDVHFQDRSTIAALGVAANLGRVEILRLLLAAGADPNVKHLKKQSQTALMEAASLGATSGIQLLLSSGARVDLEDNLGRTALVFAVQKGNIEAVSMLLAAGARNGSGEYSKNWAIEYAQRMQYHEIATLLQEDKGKSTWNCTIS